MSKFLRDEYLKNLELSEENLITIKSDMQAIIGKANQGVTKGDPKEVFPFYIIRFDNKGFRLVNFDNIVKYYKEAHRVERIIYNVVSLESLKSNNELGKSIELRFDTQDVSRLVVQDDDSDWVDATFWKLKERLTGYKNKNFLIRNNWTPAFVQMIGVIVMLFGSLWIASNVSTKLNIENALGFSFIIVLLIFSNIWTYLYQGILRSLNWLFPNIAFKEKTQIRNIFIPFVYAFLVSIFLYIINLMFVGVAHVFKALFQQP